MILAAGSGEKLEGGENGRRVARKPGECREMLGSGEKGRRMVRPAGGWRGRAVGGWQDYASIRQRISMHYLIPSG